jgi:TolA-binding protein
LRPLRSTGIQEYDQAVKAVQNFVKRFPNSQRVPDAYRIMGVAYNEMGDTRNAARAFRQAADLYRQQGRAAEAQQMEDIIKQLPQ